MGNHQGEGQERPRSGRDEIHRRIRQHRRERSTSGLYFRHFTAAGRERQPHLHGHARGRPLRRSHRKGLVRYQRRQTLQPVQSRRLHHGAAVQRNAKPGEPVLHHQALRVHNHRSRNRRHGRRRKTPRLGDVQELCHHQRGHAGQPHHQGRHIRESGQRDGRRPQGHHTGDDRRQRNAVHRYRLRIEDGSGRGIKGTHRKPQGNIQPVIRTAAGIRRAAPEPLRSRRLPAQKDRRKPRQQDRDAERPVQYQIPEAGLRDDGRGQLPHQRHLHGEHGRMDEGQQREHKATRIHRRRTSRPQRIRRLDRNEKSQRRGIRRQADAPHRGHRHHAGQRTHKEAGNP